MRRLTVGQPDLFPKNKKTPRGTLSAGEGLIAFGELQSGRPLLDVPGILANGMQHPANVLANVCRSALLSVGQARRLAPRR
jgi:hypothetical protein